MLSRNLSRNLLYDASTLRRFFFVYGSPPDLKVFKTPSNDNTKPLETYPVSIASATIDNDAPPRRGVGVREGDWIESITLVTVWSLLGVV